MISWEVETYYQDEKKTIKCSIVYESNQIYKIQITTVGIDILLQNNYPTIKNSKGKRFKWSVLQSNIDVTTLENATYLAKIMVGMEDYLRGPIERQSYADYLRHTK